MRIYKYEVHPHRHVDMPYGAKVLSVGTQAGSVFVWARVVPTARLVKHRFAVYPTGADMPLEDAGLPFIGTVFVEGLVFHVFDGGEVLS